MNQINSNNVEGRVQGNKAMQEAEEKNTLKFIKKKKTTEQNSQPEKKIFLKYCI